MPYEWRVAPLIGPFVEEGAQRLKPRLMPTVVFPHGGGAMHDSTGIIQKLERSLVGRTATPENAVVRLLSSIVEDFADEFLTKVMFCARWIAPGEEAKASTARWLVTAHGGCGEPKP